MANYTLAVGTHDPQPVFATTDADAVQQAADIILDRYRFDLEALPQEVAVLLGPEGLVTRPSERIDEFVARVARTVPDASPETVQPGDSDSPDCNGD